MGIFMRSMTEEQLQQRISEWSEELALSDDEGHSEVCRRMLEKYRTELERRKQDE